MVSLVNTWADVSYYGRKENRKHLTPTAELTKPGSGGQAGVPSGNPKTAGFRYYWAFFLFPFIFISRRYVLACLVGF